MTYNPKKLDAPFASALRLARRHADLRQDELAEALEVSLATLGRWERGQVVPTGNVPHVVEWARELPPAVGAPVLRALGILLPEPPPAPRPTAPSAEDVKSRIDDAIRIAAERIDVGARSFRIALDGVLAAMVGTGASVETVRKIVAEGATRPKDAG